MTAKKKTSKQKKIKHSLEVKDRKIFGRKVKKLREEGILPGNVFGSGIKSVSVSCDMSEFEQVFSDAGETGLLEIKLGSKSRPVLVSSVQTDPVTDLPIHVDFYQVDLEKKVTATVPVELIGEAEAEREGVGTVVQQTTELDVSALPLDLPESFGVNIEKLAEVNDQVVVGDISYDKNRIEIDADEGRIIAKVEPPQTEEDFAAPEPVEEEGVDEVSEESESAEEKDEEEASGEIQEESDDSSDSEDSKS